MIISPAHAQAAGGSEGGFLVQLLPFILIFVVFYFLLIRPQQKRAKNHRALVESLKRGDHVTTSGGIRGKVVKAAEGSESIEVEIAKDTVVEVVRAMVSEVRDKDGNVLKVPLPAKK